MGFGEALREGLRTSLCAWIDTSENLRGWFNSNSSIPVPANPWTNPVRMALCDKPPAPVSDPLPFSGGQCPDFYDIQVTSRYGFAPCSDPTDVTDIVQVGSVIRGQPGPIKWIGEFDVAYNSCGGTRKSRSRIGVENANGNRFGGGSNERSQVGEFVVYNNSTVDVTPTAGNPDNCGDPPETATPPQTPDGGWNLPPVEITYDNDQGGQTTVNLPPIIFPPVIGAAGAIFAPIRVDLPDFNLEANLEINLDGTLDIEFGSRRGPGSDTTTDTPPPPLPPGGGVPPPDDDDTERRVIGCIVTVTAIELGGSSVVFQSGGNPDVYVPDLGLVSFSVSAGETGFGWTQDIRVKNRRQYIPCPAPQGALSVRGTPRSGVSMTVTPVFGARDRAFTSPR